MPLYVTLQVALLISASLAEGVSEAACAGFSADSLDATEVCTFETEEACWSFEREPQPGTAREHMVIMKNRLVVDCIRFHVSSKNGQLTRNPPWTKDTCSEEAESKQENEKNAQ